MDTRLKTTREVLGLGKLPHFSTALPCACLNGSVGLRFRFFARILSSCLCCDSVPGTAVAQRSQLPLRRRHSTLAWGVSLVGDFQQDPEGKQGSCSFA